MITLRENQRWGCFLSTRRVKPHTLPARDGQVSTHDELFSRPVKFSTKIQHPPLKLVVLLILGVDVGMLWWRRLRCRHRRRRRQRGGLILRCRFIRVEERWCRLVRLGLQLSLLLLGCVGRRWTWSILGASGSTWATFLLVIIGVRTGWPNLHDRYLGGLCGGLCMDIGVYRAVDRSEDRLARGADRFRGDARTPRVDRLEGH